MFGCHAVYVKDKIMLILRSRKDFQYDNGVWVATTPEHHESLWRDFSSMRSIRLFGAPVSSWQNLPVEADDFEESVLRICTLIMRKDERIGKVPKRKR